MPNWINLPKRHLSNYRILSQSLLQKDQFPSQAAKFLCHSRNPFFFTLSVSSHRTYLSAEKMSRNTAPNQSSNPTLRLLAFCHSSSKHPIFPLSHCKDFSQIRNATVQKNCLFHLPFLFSPNPSHCRPHKAQKDNHLGEIQTIWANFYFSLQQWDW